MEVLVGKEDPLTGEYAGGELQTLNNSIQIVKSRLEPIPANLGIDAPQPDELQASEIRSKLAELRGQRQMVVDEIRGLRERQGKLSEAFSGRIDSYLEQAHQYFGSLTAELEEREWTDQRSVQFAGEFRQSFDAEFAKLPAQTQALDKEGLYRRIKDHGMLDLYRAELDPNRQRKTDNLQAFMAEAFREELALQDSYHRLQSGLYGAQKVQDTTVAGAGGAPNPAAIIPPAKGQEAQSWDEKLRSEQRALRRR